MPSYPCLIAKSDREIRRSRAQSQKPKKTGNSLPAPCGAGCHSVPGQSRNGKVAAGLGFGSNYDWFEMQPLISALPIYIIKSQYGYHSILWITSNIRVRSILNTNVSDYYPVWAQQHLLSQQVSPIPMFSPSNCSLIYQHTLLRPLWKQHIPFVVNYALFSTSPDDLHPASHIILYTHS